MKFLRRKKAQGSSSLTDIQYSLVLLVPAGILISIVILAPLIRSFYISFTDYNLMNIEGSQWVGLKNYISLFSDKGIKEILLNTVIFVLSTTAIQFVVGFAVALLLNQVKKGRNFFSGVFLFNWATPLVVVAAIWLWIFQPEYGILNFLLNKIGIISENIVWISHPTLSMLTIIVAHVWKYFPFTMIMLLAGLQTIPDDIVEASLIDGTTRVSRFFHITLPYLRNIIVISTLIALITNFQSFTLIWLMTGGGPMNKTTTLAIEVFRKAFELYDMGLASALGIIWLMILLILSFFYVKYTSKKDVY